MTRPLERLLRPRSVAVIGGGTWCTNVLAQLEKIGFSGTTWHVHPRGPCPDIAALPGAPDAAFVGVNRAATIEVVRDLAARGAGGAICFASGFAEAGSELDDAGDLQRALLETAGAMPVLGPNCYGLINYLDRVALWPDQHGGTDVPRGVAIVTQSSNIALNLTMQARALPLGYVVTAGNQAQQGLGDLGAALLEDPRVTALGLHIEGVGDPAAMEALATRAEALGKAVVVLKIGASHQARAATISHTASLAGDHAGARALFARLGWAQVSGPEAFLEALKIAHLHGVLPSNRVASLSCSGGEASLMADLGQRHGVAFPALTAPQTQALRAALGPRVALANPLDYHTYIWGDEAAMARAFAAMMSCEHALGLLVLDLPRADRCDPAAWAPALRALSAAQAMSGRPMAVLSSLPETLPEPVAADLMGRGVLPLHGVGAALEAIAAMAAARRDPQPLAAPRATVPAARLVDEAEAKARLAAHGLPVPPGRGVARDEVARIAQEIGFPVVLKTLGAAHKSETGGVILGLEDAQALTAALARLPGDRLLVEAMTPGAAAELLVGVISDPAHGLLLTLGRGGTETELRDDVTHALLPVGAAQIRAMLARLRCAPLLAGYRGRPAADIEAIVQAVLAVQDFVIAHPRVTEIEINPLLCLPGGAVAADALLKEDMP